LLSTDVEKNDIPRQLDQGIARFSFYKPAQTVVKIEFRLAPIAVTAIMINTEISWYSAIADCIVTT
jgi:hypothetical protein